MRFLVCDVLKGLVGSADRATPMIDSTFTPEVLFVQSDNHNGNTSIGKLFVKAPGHATATLQSTEAAELANALTIAAGLLTSKSALHTQDTGCEQLAYAAFRRNDNSADPGVPRVLQLATWTGDGSASRTITFGPPSGRRPMFAIVMAHNTASVFRDPSHTGTQSTTMPGTINASTGITGGGIDSISVGSALNANGIIYDAIVFPGDTVAGGSANGFSIPGEFYPVEPDYVPNPNGPYPDDITEPDGSPPPGPTPEPPPAGGGDIPPTDLG